MGGYRAAIDFGTSYTVAASQAGSVPASVMALVSEDRLASAVALDDEGRIQAGPYVDEALALAPDRVERTPKRCLDQPDVMLGGQPVQTVDLVAAVLGYVRDELRRHFNGRDPDELWLTHPARWEAGDPRMGRLVAAAQQAGFGPAGLLAEPCAAALALAAAGQLDVSAGDLIAVYDLGGGTFDTALLSCTGGSDFALVGEPGGDQELGGEWLDDRLFERLSGQLPAEDEASLRDPGNSPDPLRWRRAGAEFRQNVRRAKERLARETAVQIPLSLPFSLDHLSLSRAELERTATSLIEESADRFELFLQRNGRTPRDLAAICLVGGSSRLTVVNRILGNRFGLVRIATLGDPKTLTVLGALSVIPAAAPPDAGTPPPTGPSRVPREDSLLRAGPEDSPLPAGPEDSLLRAGPEDSPLPAGPDDSPLPAGPEDSPLPAGPDDSPLPAGPDDSPLRANPGVPAPGPAGHDPLAVTPVLEQAVSETAWPAAGPEPAPPMPGPVPGYRGQQSPVTQPAAADPALAAAMAQAATIPAAMAMPIAVPDYPVLPGDLQWSGQVTPDMVIERVAVGPGSWVKIGDLILVLRTMNVTVGLLSAYIGKIESVACAAGQPLPPNQPMLTMAVSGWLFRDNYRLPFNTGVMLTTGSPSRKVDPAGSASRLAVTVDNAGRRLVPWAARCLLHVPPGGHVLSAVYEQPGVPTAPVSATVRISSGRITPLTYAAPPAYGKNGKLRS